MTYTAPLLADGNAYPAQMWQAALNEIQRLSEVVNTLESGWVDYTPVWTATTNPTNGVLTGKYKQTSGLVHVTARILADATTTFGSGDWRLSLPVAAKDGSLFVGSAIAYDASTPANSRPLAAWLANASTLRFTGPAGEVTASSPFAWATGDQLRVSIAYEPA